MKIVLDYNEETGQYSLLIDQFTCRGRIDNKDSENKGKFHAYMETHKIITQKLVSEQIFSLRPELELQKA